MWICTAAETRELEARAQSEVGFSPVVLMEFAAEALLRHAEKASIRKATVFCGSGNNGGDGFAFARLAKGAGWDVACVSPFEPGRLGDVCRFQKDAAREAGVPVCGEAPPIEGLVVDAVLGTGQRHAPEGPAAQMISQIVRSCRPVLSVDVPSGLNSDTGAAEGEAVRATWTVCLGSPKPYLFQGVGAELAGDWVVETIGLDGLGEVGTGAWFQTVEPAGCPFLPLEFPRRPRGAHKGASGHLLVVAGSGQFPGAAALSTLGAVRAGAGLVTVATPDPVRQTVASLVPEAVYCDWTAAGLTTAAAKANAIVFGPGLGQSDAVRGLLGEVWPGIQVPSLLDADALTLLTTGLPPPPGARVMTPHPGEAARLLGVSSQHIQANRFESAAVLRDQFGCVAVLKGAWTVTAAARLPLIVNSTGNAGMAAAGTGDVLAGVIGALMAQGLSPASAAALGVLQHGLAGDLAAAEIGKVGFSASDLAKFLPLARSMLSE